MVSISLTTKIALLACLVFCFVHRAESWTGNSCARRVRTGYWRYYCACWYWRWGCSYNGWRWITTYRTDRFCCPGWTHTGNQACTIPVCNPTCKNGGTCESPDTCDCLSTATGPTCETRVCSYQEPCFPGVCHDGNQCDCQNGFGGTRAQGCLQFNRTDRNMEPAIELSTSTLSNIRRFDNRKVYEFVLDATNYNTTAFIWSNQKDFNDLKFEFQSIFETPDDLLSRPVYVHDAKFGVVDNDVKAVVSSIPRGGSNTRYIAYNNTYPCRNGVSSTRPQETITCNIQDENFKTLIEHGDWLTVTFRTESGGFRTLTNIDQGRSLPDQSYIGLNLEKTVQYRFDFDAPRHCKELEDVGNKPQFANCSATLQPPLSLDKDFTKETINISWGDWTDELSGVLEHYVEVFKLVPDAYDELTEENPIGPVFNVLARADGTSFPEYLPSEPGMFSVLMETRDTANNSKVARRLFLFDPDSQITLNDATDGKMFVSTAVAETGYMWQTSSNLANQDITVSVNWANHFGNRFHESHLLLNRVKPYPVQFKEIEDDGILAAEKHVFPGMDDTEGERTLEPIPNFHGIVKFEVRKVHTDSTAEPRTGWEEVQPLVETFTFTTQLSDGGRVRIWARGTDVMGNTKSDSTIVRFDTTPPIVTNTSKSSPKKIENFENGSFNYTTRIIFDAADAGSGVHKIGYKIFIIKEDDPDSKDTVYYSGETPANIQKYDPNVPDASCQRVDGNCFFPRQTVDVDNCWLMVDKDILDTSSAIVEIETYNQALLTTSFRMEILHINKLRGLEKYSGPTNPRVVSTTPTTVRLQWDLPEKVSCYGRALIVLILFDRGSNLSTVLTLSSKTTYFDMVQLKSGSNYGVQLGLQLNSGVGGQTDFSFATPNEETGGVDAGGIIGGVLGALVIIALLVIALVVLMRRGHMQPVRKRLDAISVRYRNRKSMLKKGYENQTYRQERPVTSADELYIYGGMDFDQAQSWHLSRSDVSFETLLKSGHFANIYKARVKTGKGREQAVAKTLKEGFSEDDRTLMMAKINFSGTQAGQHPNVIRFIGAVIEDTGVGPFMVYEFCENGNLRDYIVARKDNVTIELQENLFRFGLDIAKGMEYLVGKRIFHRRLAVRNMLLNFVNEVKIAGFGPQPVEQAGDGDAEAGKKERIPVKWMPPECMESTKDANEKTDVWSYGVLLWEIFTLGDQPYSNIRSRELPDHLKKGGRLPKPEQCDDTWYGVMKRAWSLKQSKRPTFKQIRDELDAMFVQASGDENYYYSRN